MAAATAVVVLVVVEGVEERLLAVAVVHYERLKGARSLWRVGAGC
jgi:hypothetical protein